MDHSYAAEKLTSILRDLNQYTADEFRRQMARIISGATGQEVPDDCHTIKADRDALATQLVDAFGDGYYDGFLDGAKHHEQSDCNTEPNYLAKDAMRCSEIAESEKASRIGISKKQQCLRDAEVRGFIAGVDSAIKGLKKAQQGEAA